MSSEQIERRLSWRSISPIDADGYESRYGRDVWRRLTLEQWQALPWSDKRVSVTFTGDDRMEQYETLRHWADTHEQPVREVKLEEREPTTWREVDV